MCGLCGVVGVGDQAVVERMTLALAHRGPDDMGVRFFPEEQVGLGHRRLSIIDLSDCGHQPMPNEDETIWIVFNGEIYNFQELRRDLEGRHRFRSNTDTEVILHLYEEVGTDVVRYLNGMFAFAIYDRRPTTGSRLLTVGGKVLETDLRSSASGRSFSPRGRLLLVRDRLGIKPLYYYQHGTRFAFGSEIKAILASGLYSPDINWQGLYDYFTYLYVPCPETIFKGIFQVPPAHALELEVQTRELRMWRYWQVDASRVQTKWKRNRDSYEAMKQELRNLLADSVQHQMISDVPLGVFLSGGVDSSILTGLVAAASSQPVKTFTIIFRGKDVEFYNEQDAARAVAHKFGTEHHEIAVDIADPTEMLGLVEFFDQPFGNPTFYLMYLISKHTRAEVKVALCGAGGDELFAGYPRYRAMALARLLRWVPRPLLGGARRMIGMVSDDYRTATLRRAQKFLYGLDGDFARQFVKWTYFLDEEGKRDLLHQSVQTRERDGAGFLASERIIRQYLAESPLDDFGNRVLHLDVQTFLLDNILEYTDKMSMAVGLEVRVPYLDHRVVEHSLAIPFHYKLRGAKSKIILKDAFADLLPELNQRAPKKGFNVPLAIWMRDRLDHYFDRHMGRAEIERQGILNWDYIQLLRQHHRTGKRDVSYELFSIIMFDVWYRKYILQSGIREFTMS